MAAAPFAGGLVVAALFDLPLWPLVATALVLAVAALLLLKRRAGTWVLLGALALAGAAWLGARRDYLPAGDVAFRLERRFRPTEAVVTGVVSSDPEHRPYGTIFVLRLESMTADGATARVGGRARVTVYDRVAARYGDRLAVAGKVSAPKPARNPGGFDYRSYLRRRGITALVAASAADDVTPLGRGRGNAVLAAAFAARRKAASVLDRSVGGEEAAVLQGLTLGKRSEIDAEVVEDFRAAGAMHLLAISGLHVGLVAFLLFLVLAGTRVPKAAANVIVMAFLPAYALLTGFNPPVVRASLMGMLALAAALLDRDVDLCNILAAAALILLIYNPLYVGDVSFLLSFAAVFAIAALYRPINNFLRRVPGILRESLAVTAAAQLGVLPLQLYFFHRFTPTSLVSNLVMVPLAGVAVALALTTVAAGAAWPALGDLYGATAWLGAKVLMAAGHYFSLGLAPLLGPGWDMQFWVGRPSPFLLLLVIFGIGTALARRKRLRVALAAAALGCLGLWLAPRLAEVPGPSLRITFLDVGQADSTFVEFPGGETLLVDAGYAGRGYDAGAGVVAPYLRSRGINSIDYLCITHGDADHAGGVAYLIREFDVGELWLPAHGKPSAALAEVVAAAAARRTPVVAFAPEHTTVGGVDVARVWPPGGGPPAAFSRNDASTVLRLSWGEFSALLMGDVERPAQELILESGECCCADVL
ncbi:MAG TPA: DNA internalization-related competence protein ComEC/Rec2 [bacterium]|nr:DNA internalization-related competence protein ComEC/Rec2 [bacterium]